MTRGGMKEYLDAIRDRYKRGNRQEKSRIPDEAERVTGRHRKGLIRALRAQPGGALRGKVGRPKRYGPEAVAALKTLWEASDRVCAKRPQGIYHRQGLASTLVIYIFTSTSPGNNAKPALNGRSWLKERIRNRSRQAIETLEAAINRGIGN